REGLAVFMENQARPYIFTDKQEQALDDLTRQTHMFSAAELKERESKPFDYLFEGSVSSSVSESYSLSGAGVTNVFKHAGVSGMQQLFALLKNADSGQLSDTADSDKIVNAMAAVSGLSHDDILFPFKFSQNFAADVASLTHADYGQTGDDAIV